jgi:predicted amidophosphoribosyltransferase
LYVYGGEVREAIRAAKYGRRSFPSKAVARRLLSAVRGRWADRFPAGFRPAVVPVPILPSKYFLRGFNLPALVGRELASLAGWPFRPLVLARTREERPQTGLRFAEREANVEGAFRAGGKGLLPEDLVVVDDVYTSGATAAACARALKTAGGRNIVVLTVSRAVP